MEQKSRASQLKILRVLGLAEGCTLLLLLAVAVPLKHLAGQPQAVSIMGPVHGLVFLVYLWWSIQTIISESWKRNDSIRVLVVGLLPFGTFANDAFLRKKLRDLASSHPAEKAFQDRDPW